MEQAEIIKRLDAIQNEFLAFDPSPFSNSSYRETSTPPDVRIARAVYWIEDLKRHIQGDDAGAAPGPPSDPEGCSA